MWSLGSILYVMLFGYPPFWVDSEKHKNEKIALYRKILKGFENKVKNTAVFGFGPWFPSHIPVSKEAKDFISHLLESDVGKRYSANEALHHPWIVSNRKEMEKPFSPHMVTTLAKFSNTCQLKLVIVKLFRTRFREMRPYRFEQLKDSFQKMDKNGDGIISYREFEKSLLACAKCKKGKGKGKGKREPLKKKYIKDIFDELNVSGAKRGIRFEDLLNAVVYDFLVASDQRLCNAFRELGDDENGEISIKELKRKLKEMDSLGKWDKAVDIIKKQSFGNKGVISREEFLVTMHPKFEETPIWVDDLYSMF